MTTTDSANASASRFRPGPLGWAIFALAAVGMGLSALSLVNHYKTSQAEYCDLGESFNCDLVNKSPYSTVEIKNGETVPGALVLDVKLPVAAIGLAGYIALLMLSRLARTRGLAFLMFLAALTGCVFALYLTYIEKYVLAAWCILCLGSLGTISLITILSAWQMARSWRS
jgi:uncharacterized membrane protein